MKNKICYSLIFIIFFSCGPEEKTGVNLHQFLPVNSMFIIQTTDIQLFLSRLDSLELIKNNPNLLAGEFKDHIRDLSQYISPGPSFISFTKLNTGKQGFVYIGRDQPEFFKMDSVKNRSLESLKFKNYTIQKYELEQFVTYTSFVDGVLLASNSLEHIQESLEQRSHTPEPSLERALAGADPKKTSVFLNHQYIDELYRSIFNNASLPLTSLAQWSAIDLDIDQEKLLLNGISLATPQSGSLLEVFSNTGIHPNEMARITPMNSAGFYSFTYKDLNTLVENLNQFEPHPRQLNANNILVYVEEAGVIFGKDHNYIALRTQDPEAVREYIGPRSEVIGEQRGVALYSFKNSAEIFSPLEPLLPAEEKNYYTWLEEFLIFAATPEALEDIISKFLNKTLLGEQEYYALAMENLAGASSFLIVGNSKDLISGISGVAAPDYMDDVKKLDFKGYPIMAVQFVQEKDFAHLHAILSSGSYSTSNTIRHLGVISTGTKSATPAYIVKNHMDNSGEVIFQDEENELFLYSTAGELVWKKQLDTRIIGDIHQVDLFKNGNLQLAFTTLNALHIIDRDGNPVKPFPISFKADITQPLSIFDYDSNRTYRFVVTLNNRIQLFDAKGNRVKGFDFDAAESQITHAPKHIRMGNKDYIVVPEEIGKLHILSRQGKSRINVKGKINFSDNEWYGYQNTFVSATAEEGMISINETGNIKATPVTGNLFIAAQNNLLVKLEENILTVNNTVVNLDYGLYTPPQIFSVNSRVYIGFTDTQAQRVYIFDQNAILQPGFPIYGSSVIQIGSSRENKAYLAVQGEEGEINIYEFQ